MEIEIIPLALKKMQRRNITAEMVREVIKDPGQIVDGYMGRKVKQKIFYDRNGGDKILRVVYEEMAEKITVVTAYFTSKVEKY